SPFLNHMVSRNFPFLEGAAASGPRVFLPLADVEAVDRVAAWGTYVGGGGAGAAGGGGGVAAGGGGGRAAPRAGAGVGAEGGSAGSAIGGTPSGSVVAMDVGTTGSRRVMCGARTGGSTTTGGSTRTGATTADIGGGVGAVGESEGDGAVAWVSMCV